MDELRRILVTGVQGQLGRELVRSLAPLGRVIGVARCDLDLCDEAAIRRLLDQVRPWAVVNAAAYTAVDRAENEPDLAMAVNGVAPGIMAQGCADLGAMLVHYSTDYVFSGDTSRPYLESDEPDPANTYGRTKLAGEEAIVAAGGTHLILRTAWVYGGYGQNFLLTMMRLGREREALRIVNDQIGAPTWTRHLAEATSALLAWGRAERGGLGERSGIYHLTSAGSASWYQFAEAIFAESVDPRRRLQKVVPIPSSAYPTLAARPADSRLDCSRLASVFGIQLPDWRTGLAHCLEDLRVCSGG